MHIILSKQREGGLAGFIWFSIAALKLWGCAGGAHFVEETCWETGFESTYDQSRNFFGFYDLINQKDKFFYLTHKSMERERMREDNRGILSG